MRSDSPPPLFADEQVAGHARAADGVYSSPSFIELSISLGRDFGLSHAERHWWAQLAIEAAARASLEGERVVLVPSSLFSEVGSRALRDQSTSPGSAAPRVLIG